MNYSRYLLAAAVATALSACGGGGGGGNSVSVNSTPTSAVTPSAANKKVQLGGFYTNVKTIPNFDVKSHTIDESGEINVLKINGESITLLPEGFTTPTVKLTDSTMIKAVGATTYARYGMYAKKQADGQMTESTVFYQGQITPAADMPTSGKATYSGSAFYSLNNEVGESKFDVDFGRKTITGQISSDNGIFETVNLKGTISGNRFSSGESEIANTMSGAFYGPKAEEIAGRFDVMPRLVSGTFGAKR